MTGSSVSLAGVSLDSAGAFEQATRGLMPALRGYAHRLTRDRTMSEDLVQETLLRAWAARDRFRPDSNLKAWLFRIEYNYFVSMLRKTRRLVPLSPEMMDTRLTVPAAQEEGLMMRDLALAIASLPRGQAAALHLVNDEGLHYQEAADRLGVALGTVKSRTTRARSAVRSFLNGCSAEGGSDPVARIEEADVLREPASEPPLSRYAAWKASGQRMIG